MLKALLKDSVLYAVPTVVSRGVALFLVPLYTRILSPADYGVFDLILMLGTFANLTVAFEIWHGVARYYSEEEDPERRIGYASTSFWFALSTYTLFLAVLLTFSGPLSRLLLREEGLESVFRAGAFYLWSHGMFFLLQNQLRWELRSRQFLIANLTLTFGVAAFSVFFAYALGWGVQGILYGSLAGTLGASLYSLWCLRGSYRPRFNGAMLREMLKFSAPLVPAGAAFFVTQYVDRFMISRFLTLEHVGLYGIGFRLASVTGLLLVGFQWALTPLIYRHYKEPDTPVKLARIFRLFAAGALLLFLGLSMFAPEMLRLMTTPAFYAAAPVVPILVLATFFCNMHFFAPGPNIRKRTIVVLWINLGGALSCVLMSRFLTPAFGMGGAACASLLAYSGTFVAYMFFSQRYYPVPHAWGRLLLALGSTIALAACGLMVGTTDVPGVIARLAILAAGVALLFATGLLTRDEMNGAWGMLRRRLSFLATGIRIQ